LGILTHRFFCLDNLSSVPELLDLHSALYNNSWKMLRWHFNYSPQYPALGIRHPHTYEHTSLPHILSILA
jgi:hypothetical protein